MLSNLKYLKVLLNDKNKKSYAKIIYEAIKFGFIKREIPRSYFMKFLFKKEIKNPYDYLSSKEIDRITQSKKLHQFQYSSLLQNKLAFANLLERTNIRVPKTISYNFKHSFFINQSCVNVCSHKELLKTFRELIAESNSNSLFIKTISTFGGGGCFLLTLNNLEDQVKKHGDFILKNDLIHQEVVKQHEDINKIYKHSLNTIRINSYIDLKNKVHIISAFQRFGAAGSIIDNASKGGFYVFIDLENGTLHEKSQQLMRYKGTQLLSHPDTGFVFKDFKIPFYKEACDLVNQASIYIPEKLVGWDIAITDSGPILIEGNHDVSINTMDLACGGLLSHPMSKEINNEA